MFLSLPRRPILLPPKRLPVPRNLPECVGNGAAPMLPTWRQGMAVGDWLAISGTNLSSVEPVSPPVGTPSAKLTAWGSLAVDTRDSRLYIVAGGGHADYSGNEADCLPLADNAPAWVERRPPTATVSSADYYADGRPASRHHYYGVTVDETNGRVMLFGGSRYNDGTVLATVDSFQLSTNDYNAAGTHPNIPTNVTTGSNSQEIRAICRDPRNDDVYQFANNNVQKWTRSSNTWSTPVSGQTGPAPQKTASAFDSYRNRIFLLGESATPPTGLHHTYDPDGNTFTNQTVSGTDISSTGFLGMVFVKALDAFLAVDGSAAPTVYRIDASTFNITAFTTSGGGSIPSVGGNGCINKFLYVPALSGCVYVPSYTGNVWFLRTH